MTIFIQKTAFFLWIIYEAPCFIPCNYVVNEFVVFISHTDGVTRNGDLCSFLFRRQHSRYQMLMKAKHVQHIMQNTVITSYRNSNLWCNLGHRIPSVTSHNLSHTFDICFICWHCWAITMQITVNTFASIMLVFMPITRLRFFQCSVTTLMLQYGECLHWWFLQLNTKFDTYTLFNYIFKCDTTSRTLTKQTTVLCP